MIRYRDVITAMPPRGRLRIHSTDDPTKPPRGKKLVTPVYDSFPETKSLIAAILHARGESGATPDMLQKVVAWARSVRMETEQLRDLANRQRRPRNDKEPDRGLENERNRALLDGVLDGSSTIRIADGGGFSFANAE